ncbi:MAG TPA: DnaJ domain-containing protein [Ottowia sp.]|uniref:J domain-containing protein n=1 Tax=Ottowia sp. TaxID=1898956 RepID=UPI002B984841|nr:DnaJ domain-containing protein [Ottowia sp.]HMN20907.1 DnaJ domain-containing protein [Ottowia sp.]
MAEQPQDTAEAQDRLARLLLDFARAPGRYAIRLGEPRALFQELDTVAQWALGRVPAGEARELVDAAVLFIQRACFDRDNTHYQVLGLTPETLAPELLRARYRTLIRLTHPDIGVGGLAADAAGMVNRAHDVLRDAAARRRYDEELAGRAGARAGTPAPFAAEPAAGPATGFGAAGFGLSQGAELGPDIAAAPGLRERWATWTARYPRQLRGVLVAGSAGLLLAGIVAWTAMETVQSAGSVLVAARSAPAAPADAAGSNAGAPPPAEPAPVLARAERPAEPAPTPPAPEPMAAAPRPARTPAERPQARATPPAEAAPPAARPVARAPTPEAAPAPASRPEPAPTAAPELEPSRPAKRDAPAEPATQRVAARPQPAQPSSDMAAVAAMTEVAAHVPAGAWQVDVAGSRGYLQDIVAALEEAGETRRLNAYLARMNVKGSLLRPVAELHARSPRLAVERSAWSEASEPGVLNIRSLLMVQGRAAGTDVAVYQLVAQFRGTPEGTVLERLDLQHGR